MIQSCDHRFGRLQAKEGHQVWTCCKGTLNWFMQSTGQSDPTKNHSIVLQESLTVEHN